MSTFDPETGVRYRAEEPQGPRAARRRRNPYEAALTAIWATSATVAVVLVLTAAAQVQNEYEPGDGAPALVGAGVLAGLAVLVGVIHLAVRAIAWRPPEE